MSLNRTEVGIKAETGVGASVAIEMESEAEIKAEAGMTSESKESASTPSWHEAKGHFSLQEASELTFKAISPSHNVTSVELVHEFFPFAGPMTRLGFTIRNPDTLSCYLPSLTEFIEEEDDKAGQEKDEDWKGYHVDELEKLTVKNGLSLEGILTLLETGEPSIAEIKNKIIDAYSPQYSKTMQCINVSKSIATDVNRICDILLKVRSKDEKYTQTGTTSVSCQSQARSLEDSEAERRTSNSVWLTKTDKDDSLLFINPADALIKNIKLINMSQHPHAKRFTVIISLITAEFPGLSELIEASKNAFYAKEIEDQKADTNFLKDKVSSIRVIITEVNQLKALLDSVAKMDSSLSATTRANILKAYDPYYTEPTSVLETSIEQKKELTLFKGNEPVDDKLLGKPQYIKTSIYENLGRMKKREVLAFLSRGDKGEMINYSAISRPKVSLTTFISENATHFSNVGKISYLVATGDNKIYPILQQIMDSDAVSFHFLVGSAIDGFIQMGEKKPAHALLNIVREKYHDDGFIAVVGNAIISLISSDKEKVQDLLEMVDRIASSCFFSILHYAISGFIFKAMVEPVGDIFKANKKMVKIFLEILKNQYPDRFINGLIEVINGFVIDKLDREAAVLGRILQKISEDDCVCVLSGALGKLIEHETKADTHALLKIVNEQYQDEGLFCHIAGLAISRLIAKEAKVDIGIFLQAIKSIYPLDVCRISGKVVSNLIEGGAKAKATLFMNMIKITYPDDFSDALRYAIYNLFFSNCEKEMEAFLKILKDTYHDDFIRALKEVVTFFSEEDIQMLLKNLENACCNDFFEILGNVSSDLIGNKYGVIDLLNVVTKKYPDGFVCVLDSTINHLIKNKGENEAYKCLVKIGETYPEEMVEALGDKIRNFVKSAAETWDYKKNKEPSFAFSRMLGYAMSNLIANKDETTVRTFLETIISVYDDIGFTIAVGNAIAYLVKGKNNTLMDALMKSVSRLPIRLRLGESFGFAMGCLVQGNFTEEAYTLLEVMSKMSRTPFGGMLHALFKSNFINEAKTVLRMVKEKYPHFLLGSVGEVLLWFFREEPHKFEWLLEIVKSEYPNHLSDAMGNVIFKMSSASNFKESVISFLEKIKGKYPECLFAVIGYAADCFRRYNKNEEITEFMKGLLSLHYKHPAVTINSSLVGRFIKGERYKEADKLLLALSNPPGEFSNRFLPALSSAISSLLQEKSDTSVRALLTKIKIVKDLNLIDAGLVFRHAVNNLIAIRCNQEVYTLLGIVKNLRSFLEFRNMLIDTAHSLKKRGHEQKEEIVIDKEFVLETLINIRSTASGAGETLPDPVASDPTKARLEASVTLRHQVATRLKEHIEAKYYDPLKLASQADKFHSLMEMHCLSYPQVRAWPDPIIRLLLFQGLVFSEKGLRLPFVMVHCIVTFLSLMDLPEVSSLAQKLREITCEGKIRKQKEESKRNIVNALLDITHPNNNEEGKKEGDVVVEAKKTISSMVVGGSQATNITLTQSKELFFEKEKMMLTAASNCSNKRNREDAESSDDSNKKQRSSLS